MLRQYLTQVLIRRNPDAIADFFDEEVFNLRDIQRSHKIDVDAMTDDNNAFRVKVIASDANHAMSYYSMELEGEGLYGMFYMVQVNVRGLISSYRSMGQPEL